MKNLIAPIAMIFFLFFIPAIKGYSQLTQYAIGGPGNELATKIRYLPLEQAVIIAGYSYDYTDSVVSNCQAILMKVYQGGAIAWQKTFGVPSSNNIIKDMIITQDGNIVVVGTVGGSGVPYSDNTAAILKYNSSNGSLMWQNCFRDSAMTTGGEFFYSVAELADGRLVAVGDHNLTPAGAGGMICVFQNNGTLIYNEVDDVLSAADEYYDVVTSADSNSVYICGIVPGNYKDGRILSYTPGTTVGTVNWVQYFDFGLMGDLYNNFFSNVFLSGSKLVISGSSLLNYDQNEGPAEHFVMTLNSADGSGAQIIGIQNNGTNFANTPAIALVDSDHIFTIQSPSTAYYDATSWITGVSTNTVVNEITSISSGTSNVPVEFATPEVGEHSFLDMRYDGGTLRLAGSTNVPSGFGNNDIYYVVSNIGLASLNHDCDTAHETISMTTTPFTNPAPAYVVSNFTPVYSSVDTGSTDFSLKQLCGDVEPPAKVNNVVASSLTIYPNPVQNELTITSPEQITQVSITNLIGQIVASSGPIKGEDAVQVDVSGLQVGVYFVKVGTEVQKFVKE